MHINPWLFIFVQTSSSIEPFKNWLASTKQPQQLKLLKGWQTNKNLDLICRKIKEGLARNEMMKRRFDWLNSSIGPISLVQILDSRTTYIFESFTVKTNISKNNIFCGPYVKKCLFPMVTMMLYACNLAMSSSYDLLSKALEKSVNKAPAKPCLSR